MTKVREMFLDYGEWSKDETSIKVMAAEREGDLVDQSELVVRIRVKIVDDRVILMVERSHQAPEVLVRL